MLKDCGKVCLKSGKSVGKTVEKSVKKLCKLFVQKFKMWNSGTEFIHEMFKNDGFARVLHFSTHRFCTAKVAKCYLLVESFPRFPHRTTNTATTFIYKGNDF